MRALAKSLLVTCIFIWGSCGCLPPDDKQYLPSCNSSIVAALYPWHAPGLTPSKPAQLRVTRQRLIGALWRCLGDLEQANVSSSPRLRILMWDHYQPWLAPAMERFSSLYDIPLDVDVQPLERLMESIRSPPQKSPQAQPQQPQPQQPQAQSQQPPDLRCTASHALWLHPSSLTQQLAQEGRLLDIGALVEQPQYGLDWLGIGQPFRLNLVQYDGRTVAVPMDGTLLHLFYRKDVLQAMGQAAVPQTWTQLVEFTMTYSARAAAAAAAVASAAGGSAATIPQYPLCIARDFGCRHESYLQAVWSSIAQTCGSTQPTHFNATTMRPLLNSPPAQAAIRIIAQLMSATAPPEPEEGCSLGSLAFARGRCALALAGFVPQTRLLSELQRNGSGMPSEAVVRASELPGSDLVWDDGGGVDSSTGSSSAGAAGGGLVPCTAALCPYSSFVPSSGSGTIRGQQWQQQQDGDMLVNRAPQVAMALLMGAINSRASSIMKLAAFELLSYLASPDRYDLDEPTPPLLRALMPVRSGLLQLGGLDAWLAAGYDRDLMQDALPVLYGSMTHPNTAWGLRMYGQTAYIDMMGDLLRSVLAGNVSIDPWVTSWGVLAPVGATASGAAPPLPQQHPQSEIFFPRLPEALSIASAELGKAFAALQNASQLYISSLHPWIFAPSLAALPGGSCWRSAGSTISDQGSFPTSPSPARSPFRLLPIALSVSLFFAVVTAVAGLMLAVFHRRSHSQCAPGHVAVTPGDVVGLAAGRLNRRILAGRSGWGGSLGAQRWGWRWRWGVPSGKVLVPGAGVQVALCVTDIQDSTSLWELLPANILDRALDIHHRCVRKLALKHGGYESATEGDSFILAFSCVRSTVSFSLELQSQLLTAPTWPRLLLEQESCRPVYTRLPSGFPFSSSVSSRTAHGAVSGAVSRVRRSSVSTLTHGQGAEAAVEEAEGRSAEPAGDNRHAYDDKVAPVTDGVMAAAAATTAVAALASEASSFALLADRDAAAWWPPAVAKPQPLPSYSANQPPKSSNKFARLRQIRHCAASPPSLGPTTTTATASTALIGVGPVVSPTAQSQRYSLGHLPDASYSVLEFQQQRYSSSLTAATCGGGDESSSSSSRRSIKLQPSDLVGKAAAPLGCRTAVAAVAGRSIFSSSVTWSPSTPTLSDSELLPGLRDRRNPFPLDPGLDPRNVSIHNNDMYGITADVTATSGGPTTITITGGAGNRNGNFSIQDRLWNDPDPDPDDYSDGDADFVSSALTSNGIWGPRKTGTAVPSHYVVEPSATVDAGVRAADPPVVTATTSAVLGSGPGMSNNGVWGSCQTLLAVLRYAVAAAGAGVASEGGGERTPSQLQLLDFAQRNHLHIHHHHKEQLIFRGLRVRVGISLAVPTSAELQYNTAAARMVYGGPCVAAAKALADLAHGGQVIMSCQAHRALADECPGLGGKPPGSMILQLALLEFPARCPSPPTSPPPTRTPIHPEAHQITDTTSTGPAAAITSSALLPDIPSLTTTPTSPIAAAAIAAAAATARAVVGAFTRVSSSSNLTTAEDRPCNSGGDGASGYGGGGTGAGPNSNISLLTGDLPSPLPRVPEHASGDFHHNKDDGRPISKQHLPSSDAVPSRTTLDMDLDLGLETIYMVTSPALSQRLALLPPLRYSPQRPPVQDVYGALLGRVSYTVVRVPAAAALMRWDRQVAAASLRLFVTTALSELRRLPVSYLVSVSPVEVRAVFPSPVLAVGWALNLRAALLRAPWPQELLRHELGEPVMAFHGDGGDGGGGAGSRRESETGGAQRMRWTSLGPFSRVHGSREGSVKHNGGGGESRGGSVSGSAAVVAAGLTGESQVLPMLLRGGWQRRSSYGRPGTHAGARAELIPAQATESDKDLTGGSLQPLPRMVASPPLRRHRYPLENILPRPLGVQPLMAPKATGNTITAAASIVVAATLPAEPCMDFLREASASAAIPAGATWGDTCCGGRRGDEDGNVEGGVSRDCALALLARHLAGSTATSTTAANAKAPTADFNAPDSVSAAGSYVEAVRADVMVIKERVPEGGGVDGSSDGGSHVMATGCCPLIPSASIDVVADSLPHLRRLRCASDTGEMQSPLPFMFRAQQQQQEQSLPPPPPLSPPQQQQHVCMSTPLPVPLRCRCSDYGHMHHLPSQTHHATQLYHHQRPQQQRRRQKEVEVEQGNGSEMLEAAVASCTASFPCGGQFSFRRCSGPDIRGWDAAAGDAKFEEGVREERIPLPVAVAVTDVAAGNPYTSGGAVGRGHWRQVPHETVPQPCPSLVLEETKWIASYPNPYDAGSGTAVLANSSTASCGSGVRALRGAERAEQPPPYGSRHARIKVSAQGKFGRCDGGGSAVGAMTTAKAAAAAHVCSVAVPATAATSTPTPTQTPSCSPSSTSLMWNSLPMSRLSDVEAKAGEAVMIAAAAAPAQSLGAIGGRKPRMLLRGLRIHVGVGTGTSDWGISGKTHTLRYTGRAVGRAVRLSEAASSGQVLCDLNTQRDIATAQTNIRSKLCSPGIAPASDPTRISRAHRSQSERLQPSLNFSERSCDLVLMQQQQQQRKLHATGITTATDGGGSGCGCDEISPAGAILDRPSMRQRTSYARAATSGAPAATAADSVDHAAAAVALAASSAASLPAVTVATGVANGGGGNELSIFERLALDLELSRAFSGSRLLVAQTEAYVCGLRSESSTTHTQLPRAPSRLPPRLCRTPPPRRANQPVISSTMVRHSSAPNNVICGPDLSPGPTSGSACSLGASSYPATLCSPPKREGNFPISALTANLGRSVQTTKPMAAPVPIPNPAASLPLTTGLQLPTTFPVQLSGPGVALRMVSGRSPGTLRTPCAPQTPGNPTRLLHTSRTCCTDVATRSGTGEFPGREGGGDGKPPLPPLQLFPYMAIGLTEISGKRPPPQGRVRGEYDNVLQWSSCSSLPVIPQPPASSAVSFGLLPPAPQWRPNQPLVLAAESSASAGGGGEAATTSFLNDRGRVSNAAASPQAAKSSLWSMSPSGRMTTGPLAGAWSVGTASDCFVTHGSTMTSSGLLLNSFTSTTLQQMLSAQLSGMRLSPARRSIGRPGTIESQMPYIVCERVDEEGECFSGDAAICGEGNVIHGTVGTAVEGHGSSGAVGAERSVCVSSCGTATADTAPCGVFGTAALDKRDNGAVFNADQLCESISEREFPGSRHPPHHTDSRNSPLRQSASADGRGSFQEADAADATRRAARGLHFGASDGRWVAAGLRLDGSDNDDCVDGTGDGDYERDGGGGGGGGVGSSDVDDMAVVNAVGMLDANFGPKKLWGETHVSSHVLGSHHAVPYREPSPRKSVTEAVAEVEAVLQQPSEIGMEERAVTGPAAATVAAAAVGLQPPPSLRPPWLTWRQMPSFERRRSSLRQKDASRSLAAADAAGFASDHDGCGGDEVDSGGEAGGEDAGLRHQCFNWAVEYRGRKDLMSPEVEVEGEFEFVQESRGQPRGDGRNAGIAEPEVHARSLFQGWRLLSPMATTATATEGTSKQVTDVAAFTVAATAAATAAVAASSASSGGQFRSPITPSLLLSIGSSSANVSGNAYVHSSGGSSGCCCNPPTFAGLVQLSVKEASEGCSVGSSFSRVLPTLPPP